MKKNNEYNKLHGDIRMNKIPLSEAESLIKGLANEWIYIKFVLNKYDGEKQYQDCIYSKFQVNLINIFENNILIYGFEDDDRLIIDKNTIVQSECTNSYDEIKLIQKSNNIFSEIYIKSYLPTANLRFNKIINSKKNLIITEGKTDWKHLKNALNEFQKQNKYTSLDFDFFEYEDDIPMCNSTLLKICDYNSLFNNDYLKIFILDSDVESINKKYENCSYINHGNNVYSLTLPIPKHRKDNPLISIEHYYTDSDLLTEDQNGRRLYLAKEFDKETAKHLEINNLYSLKINKNTNPNTILDEKIFKIFGSDNILKEDIFQYQNKKNIALSKIDFTLNIINKIKPFDKISIDNFSLIFDLLKEIQEENIYSKKNLIEISNNIYLETINDKKVLHIFFALSNEKVLEFKNSNLLKCIPTISQDKRTLYLEFPVETFSFKVPITINDLFIEFIHLKSINFSNRIELHAYNENNKLISNKELFKGDNGSIGITLILRLLYQ